MPRAALPQIHAQAVGEELQDSIGRVAGRRRGVRAERGVVGVARVRRAEHRAQRQPQIVLQDDANDAERGAPQRERVFRARRQLADGEEADQRVDFVGERERDRDGRGGNAIVRAERRVVVRDRVGDRPRLALLERVVPAHLALQLGKLADHPADEIRLAQQRRARRERGAGVAQRRAQRGCELLQPAHLLADRAELRVEHERVESGNAVLEANLAVLVPEELRVRETRAQHALVARDDRGASVGCFDVGDDEEARGQPPVGGLERKVLLVRAHGRREHFARQVHEVLVDRSDQRDGPLDQPRDFLEERRVRRHAQGFRRRELVVAARDDRPPLGGIEHDERFAQLAGVVVERRHRDALRREEAVAPRRPVGAQTVRVQRHVDDGAVEQAQNVLQRPHPAQRIAAPPHRLRPGERLDRARDERGQDARGRAAGDRPREVVVVGPAHGADLERVERVDARRLHEAFQRALRRADVRAFALLGHVRLAFRQTVDHEREPSRRHVRIGSRERQPFLAELRGNRRAQLLRGRRLHARGDLLGEQLEQQLRHDQLGCAVRASQLSQQAFASARTRPM